MEEKFGFEVDCMQIKEVIEDLIIGSPLEENDKHFVAMRVLNNASYSEIAKKLNISKTTVSAMARRNLSIVVAIKGQLLKKMFFSVYGNEINLYARKIYLLKKINDQIYEKIDNGEFSSIPLPKLLVMENNIAKEIKDDFGEDFLINRLDWAESIAEEHSTMMDKKVEIIDSVTNRPKKLRRRK